MQLTSTNQAEAFGQALLERAPNEPHGLGFGRIHRQFTLDEASFDVLKEWERISARSHLDMMKNKGLILSDAEVDMVGPMAAMLKS